MIGVFELDKTIIQNKQTNKIIKSEEKIMTFNIFEYHVY